MEVFFSFFSLIYKEKKDKKDIDIYIYIILVLSQVLTQGVINYLLLQEKE